MAEAPKRDRVELCQAELVEPAEIYAASRSRLLEIVPSLGPDALDAPLQPTPPWLLVDGYRHLTGVCANVLDGELEGAGSPAWTDAQLAARATVPLTEVCHEWAGRAPELDARLAAAGRAMSFVAFDTWTHEQDIRAAAGLTGLRDEIADALCAIAVDTFGPRYAASAAPTLRVDFGDGEAVLGEGEPVLTLTTSRYELLRMIFGRRSRAQMEAAAWSGDPAAAIDALHLFDLPTVDIID